MVHDSDPMIGCVYGSRILWLDAKHSHVCSTVLIESVSERFIDSDAAL